MGGSAEAAAMAPIGGAAGPGDPMIGGRLMGRSRLLVALLGIAQIHLVNLVQVAVHDGAAG